jgi:hypothetical protein
MKTPSGPVREAAREATTEPLRESRAVAGNVPETETGTEASGDAVVVAGTGARG